VAQNDKAKIDFGFGMARSVVASHIAGAGSLLP
jgi:hypothetical protein